MNALPWILSAVGLAAVGLATAVFVSLRAERKHQARKT